MTARTLRRMLVVSLALNLALIGHLGWRYLTRPVHPPPGPPSPVRMIEHLSTRLSPEDAAKARAWAEAAEPEARAAEAEMQTAVAAMDRELRRDPPDEAALGQALDHLQAAHQRSGRNMESLIRDLAPRLSVEGRRALIERGPPGRRPPPR